MTKRRFPGTIQIGDVCLIDGRKVEPVDIISSTSPCQDLSVAGKRQGLDGERSSLFFESTRIVREMREATNERYPRFFVWENVPGALSSNKGEDFRAVLEDIARVVEEDIVIPRPPRGKWTRAGLVRGGGWSIAWRILDAQYFGAPQRRRRIVLVADFGSDRVGEVLLERQGVSGHHSSSGEARTGDSRTAYGGYRIDPEPNGIVVQPIPQIYDMTHAEEVIRVVEPDRSPTLQRRMGTGGNQIPILVDRHRTPPTSRVRRLTPLECERLQSFPDNWTASGSDTTRYKAIGNAVNVNVFAWVFKRLAAYANEVA